MGVHVRACALLLGPASTHADAGCYRVHRDCYMYRVHRDCFRVHGDCYRVHSIGYCVHVHTVTDMHMVTEKSDMHPGGALTVM